VDGQIVLLVSLAAGGLLALLTGIRARRAYRLAQVPSLQYFHVGFVLLALSQACALGLELLVGSSPVSLERARFDVFDILFWLHYASLLGGLAMVFRSFGRHAFRWAPAIAPLLLWAGPLLQILTVLFLFFVVLHGGLNHIARKAGGSLRVSLGFFFILLGHIGNLTDYAPLEPRLWWAELVTLLGFAILYLSTASPRKVADG
jgi:hypothetical protein